MVPKLCRELPLIKLMMPPKGISVINSYGEAIDLFVYKGISGGPTQLVAINSYGKNPSGALPGYLLMQINRNEKMTFSTP